MKVAKSYKIIFLIVAFIMSTMLALGMMKTPSVYAESSVVLSTKYFNVNTTSGFTSEGLVVEAKKDAKVSFKKNLIVNDLSMKMKLPEAFTTSINVSLASFYTNGNPKNWETNKDGTEFDKTIINTLELKYAEGSSTDVEAVLNGQEIGKIQADNGYIIVDFAIEDNYLTVNGANIKSKYDADKAIYYKVKNVDDRAVSSDISFVFTYEGDSVIAQSFILEYVDQMTDNDPDTNDYKQSFKLADGETQLTPATKQRVYLRESLYHRDSEGNYKLAIKAWEEAYTLSYYACSVLGESVTLCLVNPKNPQDSTKNMYKVGLETSTSTPDTIRFYAGSDGKFGVGIKKDGEPVVFEEFQADVKAIGFEDKEAPKYKNDQIAYASFLNALKSEYTATNSQGEQTSAGLGTTLNVPSMKDLVFDNFDTYDNLIEKLYYSNDKTSSKESQMSFKLNAVGDYLFFVAFEDSSGNKMEEKDFIYEEDNVVKYGIYGEKFVFRFEIEDNADIIVKAPEIQGEGYKGVQYLASKFIIDADGCKDTYKLFYNANINADVDDANWIEIIAESYAYENDYENNGFSYDEVKKVAYDGELSFVPTRIGAYKIECTVTSSVSSREASTSTIIKVASSANVVEVPSKWLENNVWSVVFLSVGTLSLIGIIILLCIKPKEQTDND